ncbi:MAG: hypothetical protein K0S86_2447 [Geminicoccaceae bacterium]|nr:hypothetical protein [Geminicoccaceae bacterium]
MRAYTSRIYVPCTSLEKRGRSTESTSDQPGTVAAMHPGVDLG